MGATGQQTTLNGGHSHKCIYSNLWVCRLFHSHRPQLPHRKDQTQRSDGICKTSIFDACACEQVSPFVRDRVETSLALTCTRPHPTCSAGPPRPPLTESGTMCAVLLSHPHAFSSAAEHVHTHTIQLCCKASGRGHQPLVYEVIYTTDFSSLAIRALRASCLYMSLLMWVRVGVCRCVFHCTAATATRMVCWRPVSAI